MELSQIKSILSRDWLERDGSTFVHQTANGRLNWEKDIPVGGAYSPEFLSLDQRGDLLSRKEIVIDAYGMARRLLDSLDLQRKVRLKLRSNDDQSFTNGYEVQVSSKVLDDQDLELAHRVDVFLGETLHEGCHVAFTDFSVNGGNDRLLHSILNIIEDERIEHEAGEQYPGLVNFLKGFKYYYFDLFRKRNRKMLDSAETPVRLINAIIALLRFPKALTDEELTEFGDCFAEIWDVMQTYPASTTEAKVCAEKILEIIKKYVKFNNKPPQSGKQGSSGKNGRPQDKDEEENSGSGSDSKDDSEDEEENGSEENDSDSEDDSENDGENDSEKDGSDSNSDDNSEDNEENDSEEDGSGSDSDDDSEDNEENDSEEDGSGSDSDDDSKDNEENDSEEDGSGSDSDDDSEDNEENDSEEDGSGSDSDDDSEDNEENDSKEDGSENEDDSEGEGENGSGNEDEGDDDTEKLSDKEMEEVLDKIGDLLDALSGSMPDGGELDSECDAMNQDERMQEYCDGTSEPGRTGMACVTFNPLPDGMNRAALTTMRTLPGEENYRDSLNRVRPFVPAMSRILEANATEINRRLKGLKNGKLDSSRLATAFQGQPNVYYRKTLETPSRVNVCVLIDESGSMYGSGVLHARDTAVLLNEALGKIDNVDLHIYGHTADNQGAELLVYREPGMKTNRYALGNTDGRAGNWDSIAIRECVMRMRARTKQPVLMFLISDGAPNEGVETVRQAVLDAKKAGVEIVSISIDAHYDPSSMYDHNVVFSDLSDLPRSVGLMVRQAVLKSTARH